LSTYNGSDPSLPIYVAVNGSIYDVSASPRFYGQGAGYNVFAGRDASRAFVTGCLEEDLIPDLRGVEDMFVPMDLEQPPVVPEDATEAERKASRREWKLRREQARAVGRQKVRETIEIWVKTFDGGLKDKYWKVGHVKMPKDYKKNLGPPNKLCQRALDQRPRTSKEEVDVMSNLGKMS
jgi:predicted heme/steroid binding protein